MEITKDMLISNSDLIKQLKSKITGLTDKEVKSKKDKFGFNELIKEKGYSILKIFIAQFTSSFVLILIVAGIISLILGELIDGLGIFVIVIIFVFLVFFSIFKSIVLLLISLLHILIL